MQKALSDSLSHLIGVHLSTKGVLEEVQLNQSRLTELILPRKEPESNRLVCAGHARPLADTAASQTLARSDREIGGSKMRP